MKKRPIWQATTEAETGLDQLPVGALIQIENYATLGVAQFSVKNKTSVISTTTLAQAITAGNLVRTLQPTDYATATVGGTLKARVSGSALYLTTNGVNA